MQSRFRWQTLLGLAILLIVASVAGFSYWFSRPFTPEKLEPVDKPTLVKTIKLLDSGSDFAWNARGDLLAVAHYKGAGTKKAVVSIYTIDGERIQRLETEIEGFSFIDDLEWHPTKDILAVSYVRSLILWSVDGTIIKRIDQGIESSFFKLSWNPTTEQLAVVDYYAFDGKYYCQILLFDETGTEIKRFSQKFDLINSLKWIDHTTLILHNFHRIYSFNLETEQWQTIFTKQQYAIDVNPKQQLIIGNGEENDEELTIWRNGVEETIQLSQFSGRIPKMSPDGHYTFSYPNDSMVYFDHQKQQVEAYPLIKFDSMFDPVEWHPTQPILAMLMYGELQLWQFPE